MVYDARVRDTKENENKTILVTGFGPFGKHKVNASWEAVRLLPDYFKQEKVCILLFRHNVLALLTYWCRSIWKSGTFQ